MEGKADENFLSSALSILVRLGPFEAMGSGELGFLWIAEILNSGYEEWWREWMVSQVVESLGKLFFREDSVSSISIQSAWISSLLGFLSLSEKLDRRGKYNLSPSYFGNQPTIYRFWYNGSPHPRITTPANPPSAITSSSPGGLPHIRARLVLLTHGERSKRGSR